MESTPKARSLSSPRNGKESARMADKSVPVELLRRVLRYEGGELFWMARPIEYFKSSNSCAIWNSRHAGKEAGSLCNISGGVRCVVRIFGQSYLRYRVVWAIVNGRWPDCMIDHINHVTTDDRIENIREASRSQNNWNSIGSRYNTSGFKGVYWHKGAMKWAAHIKKGGKRKHLGLFPSPEDAHSAYCEAAKVMHGEFACYGGVS